MSWGNVIMKFTIENDALVYVEELKMKANKITLSKKTDFYQTTQISKCYKSSLI